MLLTPEYVFSAKLPVSALPPLGFNPFNLFLGSYPKEFPEIKMNLGVIESP